METGEANGNYNLNRFLNDMMPTNLSCHSPHRYDHLWVFWSKEAGHCAIQDHIKTALCSFQTVGFEDVLLQFWAPTVVGSQGSRLLTTCHQPFALHNMNQELAHYRKYCLSYNGEGEGLAGRVFRNQLPEFTPDVSYYSVKEYPQRDLALRCHISKVLAVPVFEQPTLQQRRCVGVLEFLILTTDFHAILECYFYMARIVLKEAGLETINTEQFCTQIREGIGHVEGEIREALELVCRTHRLPLASACVRGAHDSSVDRGGSSNRSYNDSDVSRMGILVDMSISGTCQSYYYYQLASSFLPLRVGQCLVGMAFLFHRSYLCSDVIQLSIMENPLPHIASNLKFTGCFAVCLRSIATGNHDYVLEFFLSQGEEAYDEDLIRNFLSSVLATLKCRLGSTEAAKWELENESFTVGYKVKGLFVEVSEGKDKNVLCTELTNSVFSSYKTISISKTLEGERTETEDSTQSLQTAESSLNSTCRKPVIYTGPSYKRSKLDCSPSKIKNVTELDQVVPEYLFSVNQIAESTDFDGGFRERRGKEVDLKKSETEAVETSETASSCYFTLFGHKISESQFQIPITNKFRRGSSCSNMAHLEASTVIVRSIPPGTPVPDMEILTIKKYVAELDQVVPEYLFSINKIEEIAGFDGGFKEHGSKEIVLKKRETEAVEISETASSYYFKLFGNVISESRSQIPITNECRRGSSCSNVALSEASAVVVCTTPPCTPVLVMEMLIIKVIHCTDIIKFELSSSSSMADLVENVVTRLRMLKDKAFSIEYLDDSGESNLLSSDKDLQDCMDRSRWGAKDMIRMFIHLKENVQPLL